MDFNKGKELIGLIVRNKRDKLKLITTVILD